ncbi:hypothetical protein SAMN05216404_105212 [Nitrosospira multiformis]|uniref:Uncharacterized protein n=1 Tax=Nitrosospira multiformis TaxID=1231 RepID=A0A1H8HRL2_9PROT|nr:hypothetical protein SAMN05216404_105212 [Nitrosospira multiformis]
MDSYATAFLLPDSRFISFMKDGGEQSADHHSKLFFIEFHIACSNSTQLAWFDMLV